MFLLQHFFVGEGGHFHAAAQDGTGYIRASRIIDRLEEQKVIGYSQANDQVSYILDWGRPGELPKE